MEQHFGIASFRSRQQVMAFEQALPGLMRALGLV